MRVHELAKRLEMSSKDCLELLHKRGIEAKTHSNSVDDAMAEALVSELASPPPAPAGKPDTPKSKPAVAPPAPAPTPKPAPEKEVTPPAKAAAVPAPAPEPKVSPAARPTPAAVAAPPAVKVEKPAEKIIRARGAMVVKELADVLGLRPNQLITELMRMNVLASITQKVDLAVIKTIAEKHGFTFEHEKRIGDHVAPVKKTILDEDDIVDRPEDLSPRPPVVTFLGHVDHGKTSLMDRIRRTTVVSGEYGGITQHIGAYTVDVQGRGITFLDTPGHAAFTAMRARGANLTDIAVIVIAADDGIMPQTREAIQHARAAEVALIIAINKTDLPNANIDRVKQQLQADNLAPEDWGGETICCEVSAQTGNGIDNLLEMILLQADVLELTANRNRSACGYVIEARLEPGMGPTATLLVTAGTLKIGDFVLCGKHCGKVRALFNDHGKQVKSATPSMPIRCLGFSGVPAAGAEFRVYANEKAARARAAVRSETMKQAQLAAPIKASLDSLFAHMEGDKKLELRLVLKADTQGSIEAIQHALGEIKSDKIAMNILLAATGNVTDNDVMLASASDAVILGFHVGKEPGVDSACRREGVEIRLHHVIYELIDQVRDGMTGMLSPERREHVAGQAEVREVYPLGKTNRAAGCLMVSGSVTPKHKVRVKRAAEILYDGSIQSLKHFQDNVPEIREGQECGLRLTRFNSFEKGDILEFYDVEEVKQTL